MAKRPARSPIEPKPTRWQSRVAGDAPSGAPPVDRAQLQHIIEGLSDGVILIEPDQRISWANEAALKLHGATTLADLGADVDGYRGRFEVRPRDPHRLPEGDHPLDRLVSGEAFSEVVADVARRGQNVRWVHQIRSLVLTGADGAPDCLVLLINDVTEQFEAEARFESMFNANPAPAIICRLADERFCKVNAGFRELTGFTERQLLEHSMTELALLRKADRSDLAMERLRTGRTIPQMEAWLPCADGGERLVLLAGQPIEVADKPCMLFTFADLQRRHEAHQALQHSERRFSAAFKLAPAPMLMLSAHDHRIVDANDSFLRVSGYTHGELVGGTEQQANLLEEAVRGAIKQAASAAVAIRSLDVQLRRKDGSSRSHLLSAEAVVMDGEPSVLLMMQDITERKRTEAQLREAIEQVLSDTAWFGQKVVEKLAELPGVGTGEGSSGVKLSIREQQILSLLSDGLSDQQIAAQAKVTVNTVRNHVAAIYRKIGVHRRTDAVIWARERGYTGKKIASPAPRGC